MNRRSLFLYLATLTACPACISYTYSPTTISIKVVCHETDEGGQVVEQQGNPDQDSSGDASLADSQLCSPEVVVCDTSTGECTDEPL